MQDNNQNADKPNAHGFELKMQNRLAVVFWRRDNNICIPK
jgi:hypothetical protein